MTTDSKKMYETIIDREKLMLNPAGCPACEQKFALGEPVVLACGTWGDDQKLIHESEAVFDPEARRYVERSCYGPRNYQ